MAKLTPEQWQLAKMDYEVHGLSYTELVKKYGMSKGSISAKAKNENWLQGKTEQLVQNKVNAIKDLQKTEQQIEHFNATTQQAINYEVSQRLAKENFFDDSVIRNQKLANIFLEHLEDNTEMIDIDLLNKHSQITSRNRDTALGKQPESVTQINNDMSSKPTVVLTPELLRAINQKLEDEY